MLIQLPPGMTPEQYYQTPEGQRTAERQGQDYQNLTIADDRPPRPTKYTYRPPGDTRRSHITRPPAAPAPKPPKPPGGRQPAYTGAGARQPVTRPGQAQPKADPYEAATPTPMDTFQEIFEALEEMAPDLPSHQRREVARGLAEEYRRERMEAMDSLAPPAPMAEPTEQMEFDQAYSDMQDVGRAEDRMKARMEAQLREERVAEMKKNQLEQRRANAQQGRAGVVGARPQWQMEGQRPDARGNAPAGAATGPRPGMPGVGPRPSPGMAQSIPPPTQGDPLGERREQEPPPPPPPPSQGDPIRRRSQEEMYWELVDGGMSPAEAAAAVQAAFRYMPKPKQVRVNQTTPRPQVDMFAARDMQRSIYEQAAKRGEVPRELPANFGGGPAANAVLRREQELYRRGG